MCPYDVSRECEKYARKVSSIDFNTEEEKAAVREVFKAALDVRWPWHALLFLKTLRA